MQKQHKDLLRALVRELRHKLVGSISPTNGNVERGNLDRELERLGIAPDGTIKPIDTLPQVRAHERYTYRVAVAQLSPLSLSQRTTVRSEIVERAAYTWINRLLALRAMEVRGLIDNTLRGDEAYGGISEKLFLLRDIQSERATGEDGGWWAVIEDACNEQAQSLPGLFSLADPAAALRPSDGVLVQCVNLVGGNQPDFTPEESDATFADPDAIGWAYQFYQEENKALIYAKLGSGGKARSRAEIAAATQLFTEPYMVQWLLQNSLGRSYHEAYPQSKLPEAWPYYVTPEKLDTSTHLTLASLTLLDPCVGSGHFLRAAFDMFVDMYREQFPSWQARDIADRILNHHLHGIDLDPRAAQLTALTLYLRAWELLRDECKQQYLPGPGSYAPPTMNLATTPTNLNKGALERHLQRHPQDSLFKPLIEEIFAGLEQADTLGSLLRPRENLDNAIAALQEVPVMQRNLFDLDIDELRQKIAELAKHNPGELKKLAFQRIIDSFRVEAGNTDDVSVMLFGREAEKGVKLLQLLDQQYAVVVTNPPYMGSKNMDVQLNKYIERHYSSGKRDLYAVFILRCIELCKLNGRVAMVTMQSWISLRSFADLRAISEDKLTRICTKYEFTGLLRETSIEVLAHLGRYAFSEIDVPGAPILFVLQIVPPIPQHRIWACRLVARRRAEEQANMLMKITHTVDITGYVSSPLQRTFLAIPEAPMPYYLSESLLQILSTNKHLYNFVETVEGLNTTNNSRFLRYSWEVVRMSEWRQYSKGGGYNKWFGNEELAVRWGEDGVRIKLHVEDKIKTHWSKRVSGTAFYGREGWLYSLLARGSLGCRKKNSTTIFDVGSGGIFPIEGNEAIMAILNSRVASYLLRSSVSSNTFHAGYVKNLPIISLPEQSSVDTMILCIALKKCVENNSEITGRDQIGLGANIHPLEAVLHFCEGYLEEIAFRSYNLSMKDINCIVSETGTPAGWYPLITDYDTLPTLPDDLDLPTLPQELFDYLVKHERVTLKSGEIAHIKANLCSLYEAGPGAKNVEQEDGNATGEAEEGEEEIVSGAHIPIPTETFIEELSVKMELHPISVYWLLEELRAEGARCKPEEQRFLEDRLSVLVLRSLGHRWPKQIEVEETAPEWAERSGIIPLVSVTGRATLAVQLRERLREEDGAVGAQQTETRLEELTGLNLEEWLRRRFFARHISQFKYRPVAWHLVSKPVKTTSKKNRGGGTQRMPTFECLLYYHACTTNVLARIRNEFVEPLLQIERSMIERTKTEANDSQLLGDSTTSAIASERIRELEEFAEKLRMIEEQGFTCDELQKLLTNEPLDRWCGDGYLAPTSLEELRREEEAWHVDLNDGVRLNIAPLQLGGVLVSNVLKDAEARKAIADRSRWRSDERRWVREGKLPRCGWMDEQVPASEKWTELEPQRNAEQQKSEQKRLMLQQGKLQDEAEIEEEEIMQ